MPNLLPLIQKLDEINSNKPEELIYLYQKVFGDMEGELVLVDLMMRFGEFRPAVNGMERGQHSVLIYIKNRLLGITEQPINQGEIGNE